MNTRDFAHALRMSWIEARPTLWVFALLPIMGFFFFHFIALNGSFLLMIFYILCVIGTSAFFPNRTEGERRNYAISLEFVFTRAVSRRVLYAAKAFSALLFVGLVFEATTLLARSFRLSIPDLPKHLLLAAAGLSLFHGTGALLWRYPRTRAIAASPAFFGVLIGLSGAWTQFLFGFPFDRHPFLLPLAALLLVASQFASYRVFTRQELL